MKTEILRSSSIFKTKNLEELVEIFNPKINIVVLERDNLLFNSERFYFPLEMQIREVIEDPFQPQLRKIFHEKNLKEIPKTWLSDMEFLIEMFSDLLGLEKVGLRLGFLKNTLCPKFHVDFVGIRLLCTYQGYATEFIDRSMLHNVSLQEINDSPNTYTNIIQRAKVGDIVLLKGEKWEGNSGFGAVHRSPNVENQTMRVVISLDIL